jgi:hypothetical protein
MYASVVELLRGRTGCPFAKLNMKNPIITMLIPHSSDDCHPMTMAGSQSEGRKNRTPGVSAGNHVKFPD